VHTCTPGRGPGTLPAPLTRADFPLAVRGSVRRGISVCWGLGCLFDGANPQHLGAFRCRLSKERQDAPLVKASGFAPDKTQTLFCRGPAPGTPNELRNKLHHTKCSFLACHT
jgi:hypothetical protein